MSKWELEPPGEFALQGVREALGRALDHSEPILGPTQSAKSLKTIQNQLFTPLLGNVSYLQLFCYWSMCMDVASGKA